MDEIKYVENTPFFLNDGGNPLELDGAIRRLHRLNTELNYSEESPVFAYYLDRIAKEMTKSYSFSMGPNPMRVLPLKLAVDPENSTDIPEEKYRFYVFYILAMLHHELHDYEGMEKLADRYESEFQGEPYFCKVKLLSNLGSTDINDMNEALEIGFDCTRTHPTYPELHKILAEAITISLDNGFTYSGRSSDIPSEESDLLRLGKQEIRRALERNNHPAEYLEIKARLEALNGDHEEARSSITKAINNLSRSRPDYIEKKAEFGRIKNRIRSRNQQKELEERTVNTSKSVDELELKINETENKIEDLNSNLREIRSDFQRTFLEFLGFFSAVLAVIVITGQIALQVANPGEAGRLLIVSYGGLLFAFGGFAAVLSSTQSERRTRAGLAIIGLITAVIAQSFEEIYGILTFAIF